MYPTKFAMTEIIKFNMYSNSVTSLLAENSRLVFDSNLIIPHKFDIVYKIGKFCSIMGVSCEYGKSSA